MSIARKAAISLAAALITVAYAAPSFAASSDTFLTISGIAGESSGGPVGLPQPVAVCVYLFGVQICVPG